MFCKIPWHFANKSYICTYSYLSYYLVIYLFLTILMDSLGFFGILIDSLGFLWILWDFLNVLIIPLGFLWILWDSLGFLWIPWDSSDILINALGFFGILWDSSICFNYFWIPHKYTNDVELFKELWKYMVHTLTFFAQNYQSFLAVRRSKKSPHQETGFGNRERLKVLNDTKLVPNEH